MNPEFPTNRMHPAAHWMPAAICGVISIMAMSGTIGDRSFGSWGAAFFSFLPFCFCYMGFVTKQMQNEINDLRNRLDAVSYVRNSTEE